MTPHFGGFQFEERRNHGQVATVGNLLKYCYIILILRFEDKQRGVARSIKDLQRAIWKQTVKTDFGNPISSAISLTFSSGAYLGPEQICHRQHFTQSFTKIGIQHILFYPNADSKSLLETKHLVYKLL